MPRNRKPVKRKPAANAHPMDLLTVVPAPKYMTEQQRAAIKRRHDRACKSRLEDVAPAEQED